MAVARTRVGVLFGGRSAEHEVSLSSAKSVLEHIDRDRFVAIPIRVAADGSWHAPDMRALWPSVTNALPGGETSESLAPVPQGAEMDTELRTPSIVARPVDVVFPLFHGPYGEDGTIQGMLELSTVPYVGCGVLASAVAMDKEFAKKLLAAAGLPVNDGIVLRAGQDVGSQLAALERLGLPVYVKPARCGSSVGISRVEQLWQLPVAVDAARRHDRKVLVERASAGRELECGVIELPDGSLRASAVSEISVVGNASFYDYEAKYTASGASLTVPADLPDTLAGQIQTIAQDAFLALDCRGLARVDFFLTPDRGIVVSEVNTIPGFTPTSAFPLMWEASGLSYRDLITTLLESAIARPSYI